MKNLRNPEVGEESTGVRHRAIAEELRARPPAKVQCPDVTGAIPRTRLFHCLETLTRNPITWVHAPAGSGKTTLLTTFLRSRGAFALWYNVDAGDADVNSLFHYIRLCAQAALGREISLPIPRPASPVGQGVFVRRLFESLFHQLPSGTLLVFDNYQDAARDPAWNEMFRELCTAITPAVRILVASRVAPPPALARFGANHDLYVLSGRDLRLDSDEIEQLLSVRGFAGDALSVLRARLLSLTGGWPVAVSLLANAASSSVIDVSGRALHHHDDDLQTVFEFIAREVFEHLDEATRALLLQLAMLPSFTSGMVAELTGRTDAALLVAKLQREHLLLDRHDECRFRLHDLFRLFLLEEGARMHGEVTRRALTHRAAALLADDGQCLEAIDLLVTVRDWDELGVLIERLAPLLASQGRIATLGSALDRLPREHQDARPWLVYWRSVSALGHSNGEAQRLAAQAFDEFRASDNVPGTLLAWALVVQATVAHGEDMHPLTRWLATLNELPRDAAGPAIGASVALSELLAYVYTDASTLCALDAAERATAIVGRNGTPDEYVLTCSLAAGVCTFTGQPERSSALGRLAIDRQSSDRPDPQAQILYFQSEAVRALSHGKLKEAGCTIEQGLALAEVTGVDVWNSHLRAAGGMSAIGRRDFAAAERLLAVPSVGLSSKFLRGYYQCLRGWLAFEQGDIETALRLNKESLALAHELGFHLGQCHTATSHVVYEAARGDRAGIAQALAQLDSCLGQTPSPFYSTGADLVRAYARLCNGEHPKDELRSALGRARRLGYGIFLSSKVIARLVAAALEYEVEIDCAHELIRDYALDPGPHVYALAAWPWPVKIRTLGTLSIIVDGRALEFGRKPANVPLALLKMLAASAEPVPFERMTKALWPGYGANAPRGTLDTAIYRLRKMLGSEAAVRTANGGIGLDPNVCWTDTRAFALCCDRIADIATTAGELVDGIDVAHCEHRLFDLYRGPLDAHREPRQICRARDQLHQQFRRAIADLDRLWARLANDRRRTKLRELAASRDVQA